MLFKVNFKSSNLKYLCTIVFVAILLSFIGVSTNQVFAMGQAPSTCNNRYDGPITSAKIIVGGKTYDPIAHPGLTFELSNKKSYNVTFTIHTPSQSSQGNSLPGTTWYSDSVNGFQNGYCVDVAGPNKDIVITGLISHSASLPPIGTQYVDFYTLVKFPGFDYNVKWITVPQPPTNNTATAISSTEIDLSWNAPASDGGSTIIGYKIQRSTDGGTTWTSIIRNTHSTATTYSDTGLLPNTTYYYRVFAINSAGQSPRSNIASATTLS